MCRGIPGSRHQVSQAELLRANPFVSGLSWLGLMPGPEPRQACTRTHTHVTLSPYRGRDFQTLGSPPPKKKKIVHPKHDFCSCFIVKFTFCGRIYHSKNKFQGPFCLSMYVWLNIRPHGQALHNGFTHNLVYPTVHCTQYTAGGGWSYFTENQ